MLGKATSHHVTSQSLQSFNSSMLQKNVRRDEPYLFVGLGTALPHFGSIKDTPFHVASMIFPPANYWPENEPGA